MDSQLSDRLETAVSDHGTLEVVADTVQKVLKAAEGVLPARVLETLHGEFLGHPLHPILIHLPLGGWMLAGLLDFMPGGDERTEHAADIVLTLSTLGAVPTIATGWADWSNTRGQARRTGLIHGALNEAAFFLNAGSVVARRRGRRRLGKVLSGGALGLALAGGFLGGQLVYGHGIGVGQTLTRPQG
ncbi:DUF2231 domain-containing protein [uncultured Deinococcus sp.]|uniref:DUF2231 domain-containing protein n=1 Tax=uncultured Deinococcus sp. TaxID=158789 RepID=UPI00258BD8C8|nr:DUF2231 domain-containing protein [uncultured Deinococcus sp.]